MPESEDNKGTKLVLTIKKSAEFKKVSNRNQKFHAKSLLLLTAHTPKIYNFNSDKGQNADNFCRVGYTVSKKVGNAVKRNLSKRRLRQAVDKLAPRFCRSNYDYVIIAKKEMVEADFNKVYSDLKFCLKRIHSPK